LQDAPFDELQNASACTRHAQQDLPGFDGAFTMTMFTAPVSPKAFSKRKNVSCSLKDC
jgi:hypothetical protein